MKKAWDSFKSFASGLILVFIIGAIGFVIGRYTFNSQSSKEVVSDNKVNDLKLPGEIKKETVTVFEVESILEELSEFSTYECDYTVTYGKDTSRYILKDHKIPGTTNNVTLTCKGIVKVGYDLNDIHVEVDEDTIHISIPEKAKVNDNYIIWDSIEYSEKNNILNPIVFSQYKELITEIEQAGLEQAESKGIYKDAEENFKKVIEGFMARFKDYKIEYN